MQLQAAGKMSSAHPTFRAPARRRRRALYGLLLSAVALAGPVGQSWHLPAQAAGCSPDYPHYFDGQYGKGNTTDNYYLEGIEADIRPHNSYFGCTPQEQHESSNWVMVTDNFDLGNQGYAQAGVIQQPG